MDAYDEALQMLDAGQLPVCRPAVGADGSPYVRVVGYRMLGESLKHIMSENRSERLLYIVALAAQTDA